MTTDWKALHDIPSWEWPEDAGERLLAVLRATDIPERDRLLATELSSDLVVMDDAVAKALLAVATNEDEFESVRAQAAISLGPTLEQSDTEGFDDESADAPVSQGTFNQIRETLRRLYLDGGVPMEVRRRVLEASVRSPEEWHADAIRAAWTSGDELWRLTAAFCMRYVQGFEQQILQGLRGSSADIRHEAIVAAGSWAVDDAWPLVTSILRTEKEDVSLLLAAIEAAASIRPHQAPDVLEPLLDSRDEDVAQAASDALAMAEAEVNAGDDDFDVDG